MSNPSPYANSGNVLEVRTPESTVKFESTADKELARQRQVKTSMDEITLASMRRGIVVANVYPDNSGTTE